MILVDAMCGSSNNGNLLQDTGLFISVSVKDSGIGMTPEQAKAVFDPFGKSNRHARGNGVGLSICKKICEQLEGSIQVQS